jgi:lysophospholipase L1-like esterase
MRVRSLTSGLLKLALVVALTEAVSLIGLLLARQVLAEPPVRVRRILADQSTRIARLLDNPDRQETLDPVLGWQNQRAAANGGEPVSAQGLRSLRRYDAVPADSVIRIAAYGDSFVYGSEVDTRAAWPARMEARFPNLEVLNYGVPGYGVDQALIRMRREGYALAPRYVVMGFVPDDLRRLVNVYRRFISIRERPLTKPRFLLVGDSLVMLPPPLQDTADYRRLLESPRGVVELGKHDQWYRPEVYQNPLYDWSGAVRLALTLWRQISNRYLDHDRLLDGRQFSVSSTAFRLQVALFEEFARDVRAAGARPLVLFFAGRDDLAEMARGLAPVYQPLMDEVRRRGIDFVDLGGAFPAPFDDATIASWFSPRAHYSALGNNLIADAVARAIHAREAQRPDRTPSAADGAQ